MIELRTLGALELTSADSRAVGSVLAQPRRAALLCYLALALPRGFHRRDTLFALFWPEYDADQARHALRQSVYFLRRALGTKTIVSRGDEELALASEQVCCDVWAFDAAVDQGRAADALALYRGELLAGFHTSAAPDFERWLDEERSRLRQRAGEAAWALAAARERDGDAAGAAEAARSAAALSPTDETALRRLLLLLERLGDRLGAMRAYEAFVWKLEREYELQPSAETQALVARIRAEPGESQATRPDHQRGLSPIAENGNSKADMWVAGPSTSSRLGVLPRRGRGSVLGRRLAGVAGAALLTVLIGLVALHLRTAPGRRMVVPPGAAEAAPGIAVLPFDVPDGALASWREGLVDLLSIDLSGVIGLRAIDSRTLLARWRERVSGVEIPELAAALEVAHRAGARYAVVGSVIASGSDLLVTAEVHETENGRMLGISRSQGAADSIFTLVDRLTLDILRLIFRGESRQLPRIDLARVSTSSLPALKSYLEGEVLYRRSQFQSAAAAYAMAVEADSTFALARYRLAWSTQWSWQYMTMSVPKLSTELGRFADRLPPHEAALVRAGLLADRDAREARELLEEEVRRRPDDAETWHQLGEFYFHSGAPALVPPEAADRAFARAIELDSTFTLPYIHRIDHAISEGDTTGAARLLATFARLAPESPFVPWYGLMTRLAFGDPAARSAAEAALDTLETSDLFRLGLMLEAPRCCWRLSEQVLRKARRRGELRSDVTSALFWVSLAQGKAREALGWVDDPFMPEEFKGLMLLLLDELGVPVPPARLDSALTLGAADSANAFQLFHAGVYAASRARWPALRGSLARLESRAQRLSATGDSSEAAFTEAVRRALEGYAWWRRGQRDNALDQLERSQRLAVGDWQREIVNTRLRWWLGRLLLEMGRPREALPYFESLTGTSLPADYERARIHEQLGETDRAREAYSIFLAPRPEADAVFQPMVRKARAAVQRLALAAPE
jgi:DNA-binding SARP family transcriptional activator/TolB-like protein